MSQPLIYSEKEYLEANFRIVSQPENEEEMVSLARLLDEVFLKEYLAQLKVEFKTDSLFATGSQLMKRLGFLLVVPSLYALTVYHKCLPVQLENCFLVPGHNNGKWVPNMFIRDLAVLKMNGDYREEERNFFVERLFNTIYKLIHAISNVANVPRPILWENVAIYIYWLYEEKINIANLGYDARQIVLRDFHYLVKEASFKTFHESYNPISRFHTIKRDVVGVEDPIRIRRTCCFYYETGDKQDLCTTCPKSKVNKEACRATKRKLLNPVNEMEV